MNTARILIITKRSLAVILMTALLPSVASATATGSLDEQLIFASGRGDLVLIKLLLDKGANVNAKDSRGRTPLMWTANGSEPEVIHVPANKIAEDKGREKAAVGESPEVCPEDVAKLLLDRGADVNAKDNNGETALMKAVDGCNLTLLRLLLDRGADVDAKDNYGSTALMRHASGGSGSAFLETGKLDNENAEGEDRKTPDMRAADGAYLDMAKLLLEKGAEVNAKDQIGETVLMKAVRGNQADVAKLLRAHGAEMTLIIAAMLGDKREVERFLEAGSDVNANTVDGLTALIGAAMRGQTDIAKLLLEKGADVNAKTEHGLTPLIVAAETGETAGVEPLLAKGADVNAKDASGWSALKAAAMGSHADVVELLKRHGAKE